MPLDVVEHLRDRLRGIHPAGLLENGAHDLLLPALAPEVAVLAAAIPGVEQCLLAIELQLTLREGHALVRELCVIGDGDPADDVDDAHEAAEVQQSKVIDLDPKELLDDKRLVRYAADIEGVVDLRHAVAREVHPGITGNR